VVLGWVPLGSVARKVIYGALSLETVGQALIGSILAVFN